MKYCHEILVGQLTRTRCNFEASVDVKKGNIIQVVGPTSLGMARRDLRIGFHNVHVSINRTSDNNFGRFHPISDFFQKVVYEGGNVSNSICGSTVISSHVRITLTKMSTVVMQLSIVVIYVIGALLGVDHSDICWLSIYR